MKAYFYRERLPKRLELGVEFDIEARRPKVLLRLQFILLDYGFRLRYHRGHLRRFDDGNRRLKLYVNRSRAKRTYARKRKREGVYRYRFRMEFYLPKAAPASLLRRLEKLLLAIVSELLADLADLSRRPKAFLISDPEAFYDGGIVGRDREKDPP